MLMSPTVSVLGLHLFFSVVSHLRLSRLCLHLVSLGVVVYVLYGVCFRDFTFFSPSILSLLRLSPLCFLPWLLWSFHFLFPSCLCRGCHVFCVHRLSGVVTLASPPFAFQGFYLFVPIVSLLGSSSLCSSLCLSFCFHFWRFPSSLLLGRQVYVFIMCLLGLSHLLLHCVSVLRSSPFFVFTVSVLGYSPFCLHCVCSGVFTFSSSLCLFWGLHLFVFTVSVLGSSPFCLHCICSGVFTFCLHCICSGVFTFLSTLCLFRSLHLSFSTVSFLGLSRPLCRHFIFPRLFTFMSLPCLF